MSAPARIAVLAAQSAELRHLRQRLEGAERRPVGHWQVWEGRLGSRRVSLAVTGEGRREARAAAAELGDRLEIAEALLVGLAGGLDPACGVGAVVRLSSVNGEGEEPIELGAAGGPWLPPGCIIGPGLTVDRMVCDPAEKRRLRCSTRPASLVVDMESYDVVRELSRRGTRCHVVRWVSDGPEDSLPRFLARCRDEAGRIRRGEIALRALAAPGSWPALLRLARRLALGGRRLAAIAESFVATR